MLWLSFRRVYAYSTQLVHLIPVNSLTDCIIDKPLDDSPWTAWSHLNRYPENFPENEPEETRGPIKNALKSIKNKVFSIKHKPSEIKRNNLPFQISTFETPVNPTLQSDEPNPISTDQQVLRQVSVIQTARNLVSEYVETGKIEEIPTHYTFDSARQIGQMLETVDAQAISSASNIPLSRVESGLENLKEKGKSLAGQENVQNDESTRQAVISDQRSEQAILNFAVSSANQRQIPANADLTSEKLFENTAVKIECIFNQLHAGAVRLFSAVNPSESQNNQKSETLNTFTSAEVKFADQCASRLNRLAEQLLYQADFIVLTDRSNQIFDYNDAFRYLLITQTLEASSPEEFSRRKADWEKKLAKLKAIDSKIKHPVQIKVKRQFSVRRTKIEEEKSGLQIYLNIIQDLNTERINPKNLEEIYLLLSDVTLFTSLFTYGTEGDKGECIDKLNELTKKIKKLTEN